MKNLVKHGISRKHIYLFFIITVQVFVILIVAGRKQEYSIDEIYSFILSNSYNADRISNAEEVWGNWTSGSEFNDFVTVQGGERFSYKTVYFNNSTDCHPPLFYCLLHTVCSLFPDQFSKWFGIGINIFCFIITQILIYIISRELISSEEWTFIPVILYGLSPFAIETCTFIRMYMLLTMFAMIFIYAHMLLFRKGFSLKRILLICVTIYLGALTQYYFLVMSFFGVLLYALILLHNKKIKHMLLYGVSAVVSVGLMLATYPYAVAQATGSATNNIGNEVARNLLNFDLWIKMSISLVKQLVAGISYYWLLSLIMVLFLLVLTVGKLIYSFAAKKYIENRILYLVMLSILTIFTIAFVGGEYVYLRYVYFIIPIIYISVVSILEDMGKHFEKFKKPIALLGVVFAIINVILGTLGDKSLYLYRDSASENKKLLKYNTYPLIVCMKEQTTSIPTGNLTKIAGFDSVYMDIKENIETEEIIRKSLNSYGKCIIFIPTDTYWIDGYDPDKLLKNMADTRNCMYKKVADGSLGEFYCCSQNPNTP